MAKICNVGLSVHTSRASGSAQYCIEYSMSDQADRVVITSKVVVSSSVSGISGSRAVAQIGNHSWIINNTPYYDSATYSTTATSTSPSTSVDASTTQSTTIYKTHSTQTIGATLSISSASVTLNDGLGSSDTAHITNQSYFGTLPTISARTSYTISFNANGGTGAPLTKTKWHNETLTIPSDEPTLANYRFIGWATSVARASAGTVDYTVGSVYPAATNGDAILYAVWELPYTKPSLTDVSVERCLQNGNPHDEGEYALITFNWSIYRSSLPRYYGGTDAPYTNNAIKTNGCSATIGSKTTSKTPTGTSKLKDTLVVGGGFSTDISYTATLTLEDTQTAISDHVATYNGVLSTTYFPMDFNKDATSVGFFRPAPNDEQGAFFGKDIIANNDIYFTLATGSAGTDYEIQQSITTLEWDDVIV